MRQRASAPAVWAVDNRQAGLLLVLVVPILLFALEFVGIELMSAKSVAQQIAGFVLAYPLGAFVAVVFGLYLANHTFGERRLDWHRWDHRRR